MREKAVVRILGPKCMITKRMWGRRWTRALHATRIIRNRGRRGADVPVFLDALLAVGEVLVDLHQLGLEHHPVRLQSRQYVYQVRLGLCQQRRASRHIARASCAAALQKGCALIHESEAGAKGVRPLAASAEPAAGDNVRPRWLFWHQHPTTARKLRPGCSSAAQQTSPTSAA